MMLRQHDQAVFATPGEQAEAAKLTPEQLKAMKGPSRDDPLDDGNAASWVAQFNKQLAAPSANAAERALEIHVTCSVHLSHEMPSGGVISQAREPVTRMHHTEVQL
jgi:hypothetical protein